MSQENINMKKNSIALQLLLSIANIINTFHINKFSAKFFQRKRKAL